MNFKCYNCNRTFSRGSSYSRHVKTCLRVVESIADEEYNNANDEEYDNHSEEDKQSIENENEEHEMSFDSVESTQSRMSIMSLEEGHELMEAEFSNISTMDFEEEPEIVNTDFPNDAYRDLMLLVTNHKLSNKAGNDIIQFFNKHSNLVKSPLPSSIENGRKFMDNMKFSLNFDKILITHHDGKDYFLYYQNLINCVKNIISVPDITKDFALSFKNYKVKCCPIKLSK
jgi:hypothetical protein